LKPLPLCLGCGGVRETRVLSYCGQLPLEKADLAVDSLAPPSSIKVGSGWRDLYSHQGSKESGVGYVLWPMY
jgi:hypothetical protein